MKNKICKKNILDATDHILYRLDTGPLWLLGFLVLTVSLPCLYLGQGSVFPYHDQLDETIMTYILNAKYLGTGTKVFPELLGGVNVSGMQPSAWLFVPLYRIFPAFTAFLIQWLAVTVSAFFGMYFCVKEITASSILAIITAGIFCMLPMPPVYGLSVAGVPLLLCCFLWLYKGKKRILSFLLILFFGMTTHLVLIGYVVLALWLAALGVLVLSGEHRKKCIFPALGFVWLLIVYFLENFRLFYELVLAKSDYVSSRTEMVSQPLEFWSTVKTVFLESSQHAESHHKYLILPIMIMLFMGGILYRRMEKKIKARYWYAVGGSILLILIAFFYGFNKWQPVVEFKNNCGGFLHYFQAERFYWLYPAGWYLEFILCVSLWWDTGKSEKYQGIKKIVYSPLLKLLILFGILYPVLQEVKVNSYLYMNVNQINNGSEITGYISWESYYAEDLMQELEEAIGRDITTYRVAHLGMSPAPALMHGFYTVDGYSNNYSLEYKHRFRKVIAGELEKNEQTRLYFDEWGSRCYLFNNETGSAYMLGKNSKITYEKPEFDMEALRDLGCEYLFSCGEIKNAEELGLTFMGSFTTDKSYWSVWLYEL